MKKSTTTGKPSPAPSPSSVPPSKAAAAAPKTALESPKAFGEIPKPAAAPKASAPKVESKVAPRAKPTAPAPRVETPPPPAAPVPVPTVASTVISAKVDIGFGNALFIRGEGPGLSWEKGLALDCASSDLWTISLKSSKPILFKLLINDSAWSLGEDFTAKPGSKTEYTPSF